MPTHATVALRDVSFSYDSATSPLFSDLSVHLPVGFTGIVGANGTGKTTLLRVVLGEIAPSHGSVDGVMDAAFCGQRTDNPPQGFEEFLTDQSAESFVLRGRLQIEDDFLTRWQTLSHGERKRAQIAEALWRSPPILALDEPTNHIDLDARTLLLNTLRRYRGVGLLVSHDRELLDELCDQCLWLEPPEVKVYAGGYSAGFEQRQSQRGTAAATRKKAQSEVKRLEREARVRRDKASNEHKVRSKAGLAPKDHDAREKIDRGRVSDSGAGSPLRQLGGRREQAQAKLEAARVSKEYETGIWLPGSKSPRAWLLQLSAGQCELGDGRQLRWPGLHLGTSDRVAITGANGIGKSTFIAEVIRALNVPERHLVYLPQEISASAAAEILNEARGLPGPALGQVMNVVSRLGSRPQRLLGSDQPSPGEIRKLLLALGMVQMPHVIVMDEPTNHLDLPSIEALEQALADCPCALILVSHDLRFISAVGATRWVLQADNEANSELLTE